MPITIGDRVDWHQPGQAPYSNTGVVVGTSDLPGFVTVRWVATDLTRAYEARVHRDNCRSANQPRGTTP